MLIFGYILTVLAILLAVPVFSAAAFDIFLALSALIPRKIRIRGRQPSTKIAVLIPAHNAEKIIEKSIRKILTKTDYPDNLFEVIVIAENCTDSTSFIADFAGARVLERTHQWHHGEDYAVEWAIAKLEKEKFGLFLILPAGSVPAPKALRYLDAEYAEGHIAMQLPVLTSVPEKGLTGFFKNAAGESENYIRSKGLDRIGFSAPLPGAGTCLSSEILKQYPFIAELESSFSSYFAKLLSHGEKVRFICEKESELLTAAPVDFKIRKKSVILKLLKESFKLNFSALAALCATFTLPPGKIYLATLLIGITSVLIFFAAALPECSVLMPYATALCAVAIPILLLFPLFLLGGAIRVLRRKRDLED